MKVQNILATKGSKVFTITPEQSIQAATSLMAQHNIGALVITNAAGGVVGIISERDIVRFVARHEDPAQPVSTIMSRNVILGSLQDELSTVMRTMTLKRFRHLPVVDHEQLVGMVSIGDLVKAQLAQYQGEIETLLTQVTQGE
ncbi:MAG: CBS domain-containing protein [Anaerolineales bacterium]|nr:CBS domain-containing protein [Anaerolineales bacterium]